MTLKINGKIGGAVMNVIEVEAGRSFVTDEKVVQLSLKSSHDSNSSYNMVLSKRAAKRLIDQLVVATTFDS